LTDGMNVGDWLRLLNGFVFFFTSSDRLQALRSAYRTTPAVLLTVRTRSLVREHGARVRLAGMNTGNTSRRVKERGAGTFLPVRRYDLRPCPGGCRDGRGVRPARPLAIRGAAARRRLKRTVSCTTGVPTAQHRIIAPPS
jgi:hypothetical protein